MVSKKLSIYGFISAATVVCGLLAGCGGSSSVAPAAPIVATSGGLGNLPGTGPAGTVGTGQQVQVNVGGQTLSAVLPAGETIPSSGSIAVLNPTSPILSGLTLPSDLKVKTPPMYKGHPLTGGKGEVYLNGVDTGIAVTGNGLLSLPLILVPGSIEIEVVGPFLITDTNSGNTLTVDELTFVSIVSNNGSSAIPTLQCQLPANGNSFGGQCYVQCTYPTNYPVGNTTLTISYRHGSVTVNKGISLKNGIADFKSLGTHPTLGSDGVDNVTFTFTN
jgi:hypothetical protein